MEKTTEDQTYIKNAIKVLKEASASKKCRSCGCFHGGLSSIENAIEPSSRTPELDNVIQEGKKLLAPIKYDCLGCDPCLPPLAITYLEKVYEIPNVESACSCEAIVEQAGWPHLPGNYTVLRYQAPVAICTITDGDLAVKIANKALPDVAIVGTMHTENLGIERLISNVISNPNIRFLIICGADSQQKVGHLPGQSLVSLGQSGIDGEGRIIGALGKRPILRNIPLNAIEHFRKNVEIIDCIDNTNLESITSLVKQCSARNPGTANVFSEDHLIKPIPGYLPKNMTADPFGYFVIYVNPQRKLLSMEHYGNDGTIDTLIEGKTAVEVYYPAIENKLVSRLDHAAYLGKELARAEKSMSTGTAYIQDAAPEAKKDNCGPICSCHLSSIEVK